MVGETGLEPAPVLPDNDLNVARIPFPPLALKKYNRGLRIISKTSLFYFNTLCCDNSRFGKSPSKIPLNSDVFIRELFNFVIACVFRK